MFVLSLISMCYVVIWILAMFLCGFVVIWSYLYDCDYMWFCGYMGFRLCSCRHVPMWFCAQLGFQPCSCRHFPTWVCVYMDLAMFPYLWFYGFVVMIEGQYMLINGYLIILLCREHKWYSGSALDYWKTGRTIDPAPGA